MASPTALLHSLQALADAQLAAEGVACFRARRAHGVRSLDMPGPLLTLLLQGRQQMRVDGSTHVVEAGELLLVRRPCSIDVTNTPGPQDGGYLSLGISLCHEVLDAARLLWAEPITTGGTAVVQLPLADHASALERWSAAMHADDYAQARLALTELLLALCRAGHAAILAPLPPSLAAQLRALVAARPERDWQSRDFEAELGLSGATLRRRLQAEGTSMRAVVAEARLARALELLYGTRLPVKTVAARVGYRSVASFTRRFGERYGLEPGQIGNQAGGPAGD
ncbi:AraC family transcriptional regulator [Comamonas humi]